MRILQGGVGANHDPSPKFARLRLRISTLPQGEGWLSSSALPFTRPPSPLLIEPQVRAALEEDLGRAGDITSDLIIPADQQATARLVARKPGRIAGVICAEAAFRLVDPSAAFEVAAPDGSEVSSGALLAT